ncbi:MAG: RNA polymerase subunit sigma-70 [Clostridiales bacterium]|nr:RNA polymerase subunit sigma-70 [Clostridiales bacterium]
MEGDGLKKKVGYGLLAAFYAPLLTDRQQSLLAMYCDEDLSLSEIARQLSISRQAVSDHLNRAYERLDGLEGRLKLYQGYLQMGRNVAVCRGLLDKVVATPATRAALDAAKETLDEVLVEGGRNDGV